MSNSEDGKGLENEREKIIQNKIEKLESELEKEKQKRKNLEKKIEKIRPDSNNVSRVHNKASKGISRRDFLKKAGLGTAGLAALASPVSALDVKSNDFNVFADSGSTQYFSVGQNGPVNIQNTYLDLNQQNIRNIGALELPKSKASNDGRLWLDTSNNELKVKIGGNIYASGLQNISLSDPSTYPDGLIHRWHLSNIGDQIFDDVGGATGSNSGITEVSGNYSGGEAGEGGNDRYYSVPAADIDESEQTFLDGTFALSWTVSGITSSPSSRQVLCGNSSGNAGSNEGWTLSLESTDQFRFRSVTPDGEGQVFTGDISQIYDGNPHRIVVTQNGSDGETDVKWYVDNSSVSTTSPNSDNVIGGASGLEGTFGFFDGFLDDGSRRNSEYVNIIDEMCWYNEHLTSSGVDLDYTNQPWT